MLDRAKARHGHAAAALRLLPRLARRHQRQPALPAHPGREVGYASEWGMNTEIEDLRRVVPAREKPRRQGRPRRPLARRHDHHRLRDVGLRRPAGRATASPAWSSSTAAAARRRSSTADGAQRAGRPRQAGSPWLTFGGIPAPFAGLFNSTGALGVIAPDAPSLAPGLPAAAREPQAAGAGDQRRRSTATRSTPRPRRRALAAAQAHLGHLAASGDPRGWVDAGELTPLRPLRRHVLRLGPEGPRRHGLVPPAAPDDRRRRGRRRQRQPGPGGRSASTRRTATTCRGACASTPSAPRSAARACSTPPALAAPVRHPARRLTLVDRHATYAHNDPNSAAPARNAFLKRLIPFLSRMAR